MCPHGPPRFPPPPKFSNIFLKNGHLKKYVEIRNSKTARHHGGGGGYIRKKYIKIWLQLVQNWANAMGSSEYHRKTILVLHS